MEPHYVRVSLALKMTDVPLSGQTTSRVPTPKQDTPFKAPRVPTLDADNKEQTTSTNWPFSSRIHLGVDQQVLYMG